MNKLRNSMIERMKAANSTQVSELAKAGHRVYKLRITGFDESTHWMNITAAALDKIQEILINEAS